MTASPHKAPNLCAIITIEQVPSHAPRSVISHNFRDRILGAKNPLKRSFPPLCFAGQITSWMVVFARVCTGVQLAPSAGALQPIIWPAGLGSWPGVDQGSHNHHHQYYSPTILYWCSNGSWYRFILGGDLEGGGWLRGWGIYSWFLTQFEGVLIKQKICYQLC